MAASCTFAGGGETLSPAQWTPRQVQEWLRNEGLNAWPQIWSAAALRAVSGPQLLRLVEREVRGD